MLLTVIVIRIFKQIQIPASETSRSRGFAAHRSLFEIDLWASLVLTLCCVFETCKVKSVLKLYFRSNTLFLATVECPFNTYFWFAW
jgi:hypothetical protein